MFKSTSNLFGPRSSEGLDGTQVTTANDNDEEQPDTDGGLDKQSVDEASISSQELSKEQSLSKQPPTTQNHNTTFLQNTSKMNRTDRWLVEKYAPFVSNRRWWVIFATVILALVLGIVSIFTFAMNNGTIVIFTESYNLGRLTIINEEYFNGDVQKTTETIYLDPTVGPTGPNGYGNENAGGQAAGGGGSGGGGAGGGGPGGGGVGGAGTAVDGGVGNGDGDEGAGTPAQNPFEDSGLCPIPCQNGGICNWGKLCCYCTFGNRASR